MRVTQLLLTICMLSGCAQTAIVRCVEPAKLHVTGIRRVAVAGFTGQHGEAVATSLSTRLWENDFYTVVDRSELMQPVQMASQSNATSLTDLIQAAQAADVDGIIVGKVVDYRCEDRSTLDSDEPDFARNDQPLGTDIDFDAISANLGSTVRAANVTLTFQLIDVNTGEIKASRQISQHFQTPLNESSLTLQSDEQILDDLTHQCVEEIVEFLAPHESECQLTLAKCDFWTSGAGHVREGLQLADKGDWEGAEAQWNAALEQNAENHAAAFNLAVAAVRRQDYKRAETWALQALKIEHKECYTAGLDRIRERRSASEKARDQRDSRMVSLSDSLWQ